LIDWRLVGVADIVVGAIDDIVAIVAVAIVTVVVVTIAIIVVLAIAVAIVDGSHQCLYLLFQGF
jgi:hypothetical protein